MASRKQRPARALDVEALDTTDTPDMDTTGQRDTGNDPAPVSQLNEDNIALLKRMVEQPEGKFGRTLDEAVGMLIVSTVNHNAYLRLWLRL